MFLRSFHNGTELREELPLRRRVVVRTLSIDRTNAPMSSLSFRNGTEFREMLPLRKGLTPVNTAIVEKGLEKGYRSR